jgi:hypothetical protein
MKARGENVTRGAFIALALSVAVPAASQAQSSSQAEQNRPSEQKRRNNIQVMEGVLTRAGVIAAEHIATQLQQLDPSMTVFIGDRSARARGFVLEGYGVFFDVEVPELRGAVVWSQITQQRDMQIGNALSMLKRALQEMPEGPNRQQALAAIRLLDVHAGPVQQQVPNLGAPVDPAMPVSARSDTTAPPAATASAAMSPTDVANLAALLRDPNREYRDAVQRELTDVMLDYGSPMDVGPDDWLCVAARVAEAGQRGQTLMLRVKGSDLAIYAGDKSRRDEIRSKVEVRVY